MELCVRKQLDCMTLAVGSDTPKSLWVNMKVKENKTHIAVGSMLSTIHPG